MLHKALSLHFGVPFGLKHVGRERSDIPTFLYTHELVTHLRDDPPQRWLVGRSLIPDSLVQRKKLVILVRDPGDVIVSSYFHMTKRWKSMDCELSEYIRHRRHGIHGLVWALNRWRKRFQDHPDCLWLRYEDMKQNPRSELEQALVFLGIEVGPQIVAEAVEFASFDNMQRAEASRALDTHKLQPGSAEDPESFKVRRGKVKGYLGYLAGEDLNYVHRSVTPLDPFYGYSPHEVEERALRTGQRVKMRA